MNPANLDLLIETLTDLNRRLDRIETRLDSWATVTQVAPLRVRLDRDLGPLDNTPIDLVGNLAVGARVRIALNNGQIYVTHALGGPAPQVVTYTPTLTSITLGGGTATGRYQRVGDWVSGEAIIVLGSTGAVTGNIGVALPVARVTSAAAGVVGQVLFRDASTGGFRVYSGYVGINLSTGMTILGPAGEVANATVPWAWAPGDSMRVAYHYQVS